MRKFLFALALSVVATCSSAFAGSPTIAVFTDGFGTGVGSPARANTPTGATTGSYGPPNSSWGVGNGLIDVKGSTGAVPGTGWNIAGTYASDTYVGTNFLEGDSAYTPGPNEAAQATFVAATNTSTPTYGVTTRGVPNTDSYLCYYANNSEGIVRLSGGNATTNQLTSGTVSAAVGLTSGHNLTIKLTTTGDGATTTTNSCTVTDATTSTVLTTISGTDTTGELQSGGRVGVLGALNSGTVANVSQFIEYSDTPVPFQTVYIGFAPADSFTYGLSTTLQNAPDVMCRMLNARQTTLHFIPVNMGFSGSTYTLWQNGNASGYMAAAVQNFNALGVKFAMSTLGGNDAVVNSTPAATFNAGYQADLTYLKSQVSGLTLLINMPPYFDGVRYTNFYGSGNANALALIRTYGYTSLTGVTLGDITMNTTFQQVDYFGLTDGGHPSDQGVPVFAFGWLMQYLIATGQIQPGITPTVPYTGH